MCTRLAHAATTSTARDRHCRGGARLLRLPATPTRPFWWTIGEPDGRRDDQPSQMVGPGSSGQRRRGHHHGLFLDAARAMAMGERTPLAFCSISRRPRRMAVAEACEPTSRRPTSAASKTSDCRQTGWRPAASRRRRRSVRHRACVGEHSCPASVSDTVGKDSLSMAYGVARGRRRAPGARARIADRLSICTVAERCAAR